MRFEMKAGFLKIASLMDLRKDSHRSRGNKRQILNLGYGKFRSLLSLVTGHVSLTLFRRILQLSWLPSEEPSAATANSVCQLSPAFDGSRQL